jgi:HlyD family secretion protein
VPNAALRFQALAAARQGRQAIPQDPLPPLGPGTGALYVLTDDTPGAEKIEPRVVEIGITDGVHTVLKTDLGDAKIVTDETDAKPKSKKALF